MGNLPLVSIICTSYNHEAYITDALEGFVMQKTNFPFEIIVHDDASTDNTASIAKSYEIKYPDLFANIYQTENQYSKGDNDVGRIVFGAVRGKYIALCEGDDYWIDPMKLQKQVDFLEAHNDYGMVYSKAKVYLDKDRQFKKKCFGKSISTLKEMLLGNYISTPTVLYRKELYFSYLEEIRPNQKQWLMGDYPLWLWFASKCKIKYFDEAFSVYRSLETSASHSTDVKKKMQFLNSYMEIKLFFMNKYGYEYLEHTIWGQYFTMKSNLFIFNNEENIQELISEINGCNIQSNKIRIIELLISYSGGRELLKFYWKTIKNY